jgi:hypothetical protein
LSQFGFSCQFFGDTPVDAVSIRQKILRPIKKLLVDFGLMPRSMASKKLLKRLVCGGLIPMPAEIREDSAHYKKPTAIPSHAHDITHKVIYCEATRN